MDKYKIIHPITLGAPGVSVSKAELEEAGVDIDALLSSGHIQSADRPVRSQALPEE
jgi:hypothetical protein